LNLLQFAGFDLTTLWPCGEFNFEGTAMKRR